MEGAAWKDHRRPAAGAVIIPVRMRTATDTAVNTTAPKAARTRITLMQNLTFTLILMFMVKVRPRRRS